jgi:hypothetical protein
MLNFKEQLFMDIEKQPDDTFITIAGMYVDSTPKNKRLFASLARNAKDIYELIYHPDYYVITENNRSESDASLESILNECLSAVNQKENDSLIRSAKKEFIFKRIKNLNINR